MVDVFVSYKAEDRRRVVPLVQALEADGLTVWWGAHIGGGVDWRDSIEENLDAARCSSSSGARGRSRAKGVSFATKPLEHSDGLPIRRRVWVLAATRAASLLRDAPRAECTSSPTRPARD